MVFGVKVATTIGKGIVNNEIVHPDAYFILSALLAAILWVYFCGKKWIAKQCFACLNRGD